MVENKASSGLFGTIILNCATEPNILWDRCAHELGSFHRYNVANQSRENYIKISFSN